MAIILEEIEKRVGDSYELPNNVLEAAPKPMVTIRTSTYQHDPYIKQCIEGVLMQKTNFPIEFIIGEDFSTDGTREIVFDYAKKFPDIIRVITADYNVGSIANGRRCINASRGKYMAICEGDDYWTDSLKLQKQVDFLEANPDYGLVRTNYSVYNTFNGKTTKNRNKWKTVPQGWIFNKLLINNSIATLTIMIKSVLVIDYLQKFGHKRWLMGDYPLWLFISQNNKIGYLNQIMAIKTIRKDSAQEFNHFPGRLRFINSKFDIQKQFLLLSKGKSSLFYNKVLLNHYVTVLKYSFLLDDYSMLSTNYKKILILIFRKNTTTSFINLTKVIIIKSCARNRYLSRLLNQIYSNRIF